MQLMKVIDYEPQFWFFLKVENEYFIDVYCNQSFVGFNLTIKIDELEIIEYHKNGKVYLNSLANDIQYFALSKYKERDLIGEIKRQVFEAILKFNEEKTFKQ